MAPPLYLWSRADWTETHKTIEIKQGHTGKGTEEKNMEIAQNNVLNTKPPNNGEGNYFQMFEGKATSEIQYEKGQKDCGIGIKYFNFYGLTIEKMRKNQNLTLYPLYK